VGWFDLHVHTRALSEDADLDPEEAALALAERGFAGFALTEHNAAWSWEKAAALGRDTGLVVVPGVELEVEEIGHVLVFGWDEEPLWRYHRWARLQPAAREKGAVLSVAHPFRAWFPLWAGQAPVMPSAERARRLEILWGEIGCLEAENGRARPEANHRAEALAAARGWRVTAGSDAHHLEDLGIAGVELPDTVGSAAEAVAALRQGQARLLHLARRTATTKEGDHGRA
jgi:predicted metal-dependent phosphoesterase TrpH